MAVIFGDKVKSDPGWLRVTCIQWQIDSHENGYTVDKDDIPEYPKVGRGKAAIQMYNPTLNEWRFDEVDVPLTKEQILEELVYAVKELTAALKERK
jgi:hypothetical protein